MANERAKAAKGGWVGSALGAVVGIAIGGLVGDMLITSLFRGVEWADALGIAHLLGSAMGGVLGGIGGSAMGTRLGAWLMNPRARVPAGSADAELAPLKESVAELEEK